MKKLLILGGFPQMIDIVMTARKMGIYTIVVDRDASSPAKRFANLAVDLSTDQIDKLELICRKENVNGVFCGFEDFNIHIACELCNRLGLPFYGTAEQIQIVTNKLLFKEACRKASAVVLEPIMKVSVIVPEEYTGDVIGDVSSRRGNILGMEPRNGATQINANVPLSEMFGYATDLRSRTQGRGQYSMEPSHYTELPKSIQQEIVEKRGSY